MDDLDLPRMSGQLSEFSTSPVEDIPEAVREAPKLESQSGKRSLIYLGFAGLALIVLIPLSLLISAQLRSPSRPAASASQTSPTDRSPSVSSTATPASTPATTATASPEAGAILNHLPYEEAPPSELEAVTPDGSIKMRRAAAQKFMAMVDAAQADGVALVPLSGFRSVQEQTSLFFETKAERGQTPGERASVSAPPGHSEHHTGYAVDIGDGARPDLNLSFDFDQSAAFKWLQKNAAYYSFELSFPKNNVQKISYEPWHWRFVGDRQSLETFYRARSLAAPNPSTTPQTP